MKLQHKAWALILVTVGLCSLAAMFGMRWLVGDSFSRLERERAAREGDRASRLLSQQVQGLSATVRDYAQWVDAVSFAQGRKPSFVDDNFDTSNMGYLRISEVLIVDAKGNPLTSLAAGSAPELMPVSPERLQELRALLAPVIADPSGRTLLQTYRVQDGRLDLVTASAIRDPDRPDDVSHGAILMLRHFDEAELQHFSELLMMPVRLSFDHPGHLGELTHLAPVDDKHEDLHAVLRDQQGQPVAELVLSLDRQLFQAAQSLSLTGMALSALAGLLASLLLVVLLDRLLLRRLQALHREVQGITERGPTATDRLQIPGKDELSTLGEGINRLLERVQRDAQTQREAHERHEALQVQLMQSQKTEALGRLTGGIAHDFNNSLAAITGWVRLASEDLDTEHPSHEALQQALKATRYADGLMRQLLAFGRQSAPKLQQVHLSHLIEETRQMMASGLTRECELVVECRVDDDEVVADPTQLQQVLVNLLINAADAMKGKGRIELLLGELELPPPPGQAPPPGAAELNPGRYLVLQVCDRGPGIPPEHLDRLFEPFFTTKPKGRGTGLGLSVAQGIMARHQGAIGLRSEVGEGACFMLYLPESRHDATAAPLTTPGGGSDQGRQLLFVDDDQSVRHAWSALLERKGWQVTRSRDGEEAWAQFMQTGKRWDLVLTDQSMPRLDGVGLALRIRATQSPPPIVLMSGHANEVPSDLLQTLFAAVLHKPVDANELERALQKVLAPS